MRNKIEVLIVEEGVTSLTLAVISCFADNKNIRLHCLSFGDHKFPAFRCSRHLDTFINNPSTDDNNVFGIIKARALELHVDIIVPINEKMVQILSVHGKEIDSPLRIQPVPELPALDLIRNKWLLYKWLYENNYSAYPAYRYVDIDRNQASIPVSFPFLIKPFWGSGGEGIVLIRNHDEFLQFTPETRFPENDLLIQPFIEGIDIDISLLAVNGVIRVFAIQKGKSRETRLKYSWQIEFLEDQDLLDIAADIIGKLNYSGIAHLDFRFNKAKQEYTLVDFNARYWTTLTGALNAGINFPLLAVYEGLGVKFETKSVRNGNYSMTSNLFGMIASRFSHDKNSRIRYKESELYYSIRDPFPYLLNFFLKTITYLGRKR